MFLSKTSLVPTVLAMSDFFIKSFPYIGWYPYWYLGNPYQYLIGPVVPVLLSFLNLFNLPLLYSYAFLIWGSFILGSFGIYLLLKDWGLEKKQALFSAFLYLILPAGVYLLNYQNGLNHLAFGIFPYLLLVYQRFLQNKSLVFALLLSFLISLILLIDISILLSLIVGFASIFLSNDEAYKKDFGNLIGKTIVIILLSLSFATLWYTPRFWLVNLVNPSFGGVPLFRLIASLFQFFLNFSPIGLAVLVVHFRKFKPKGYMFFATLFFSSFLFLTIVRFLSDPDFVTDWISFLLQLQFGGAIIIGSLIWRTRRKRAKLGIIGGLAFLAITGSIFMLKDLFQPRGDYQKRIVLMISKNVESNKRVFLSGSSVFWINSFLPVQQVRGGVDQASVNLFWAHAAYQIREGTGSDLSHAWLSILGASYILVHGLNSKEPFRDFKHPEKFTSQGAKAYFKRIDTDKGDTLYRVEGASIAKVANLSLLSVPSPRNGADRQTIFSYEKDLKEPLDYHFKKDGIEVAGKIGSDEVISLAVTYSPYFKVVQGQGRIVSDSIGNLAIIPKRPGEQKFILQYQQAWVDYLISLLAFGTLVYILIFYDIVIRKINRFIPKLHLGLEEEY